MPGSSAGHFRRVGEEGLDREDVTNHFNPFMLYFNSVNEEWEEIALLPILPNFSYRISF